MRRRYESQRFDQAGGAMVNVYERAGAGRWILVDSFECRVRVRRITCRPKVVRP